MLPVGVGFAAGAMVWVVASDLGPDAVAAVRPRTAITVAGAAALAMIALQLALNP